MVHSTLLCSEFSGKLFLPGDATSQEAVSRAVEEGLLIVFPGGRVGLSKRGRRVRRQLEIQKFSEGDCNG